MPEISLRLATPETRLWRATPDEATRLGLPDPYWAFCWAGGQALARYVLDYGGALAGRRVLDFGAGGGVVGIAAALVGARVLASELDPVAIEAIRLNAELNGVEIETTSQDLSERSSLPQSAVLVGDVTYEAALARRVLAWLSRLAARGTLAIVADPGRGCLEETSLELLARHEAPADNDRDGTLRVPTAVLRVR